MTQIHRLYRLSRADFLSLKPVRKEQGRFFVLTVAKSPDNKPRFACVVSKKTARKAVVRNLIKRRCRAALRQIVPAEAFSYVFTAKKSALEASQEDFFSDVQSLIVKTTAGLMRSTELQ